MSVYSNLTLTAAKLAAAIASGSVLVLSEVAHSLGDILASALAWMSVRVADKPADAEHPYGHGKVESLAVLAEAALLLVAAGFVAFEAVTRISHPEPIQVNIAFWIVLITAIWNVFIGRYLRKTAKLTDSVALHADAAHITADIVTSAGILVGLGLVWLTKIHWIDPVCALALTAWIVYTAIKIARSTISLLLDETLPPEELDRIKNLIASHPDVRGFHQLRTRKSGSHRHIDAHLLLDDDLSLLEAHRITEEIEDLIRSALPNVSISLHMEPHHAELAHRMKMHNDPPNEARL